jgi:hypothetical protein
LPPVPPRRQPGKSTNTNTNTDDVVPDLAGSDGFNQKYAPPA